MRFERSNRSIGLSLIALLAVGVVGAIGCAAPSGSRSAPPSAGETATPVDARADEAAVIAAHREFIVAIQRGDIEGALARLDPSNELLIFHPYVENRFDGIADAREGLARMFARLPSSEWTEVHPMVVLRTDVAWITYQVLLKSETAPEPFVGRGTEIWNKRDEGWRLIHAHWSEHARIASAARGATSAP